MNPDPNRNRCDLPEEVSLRRYCSGQMRRLLARSRPAKGLPWLARQSLHLVLKACSMGVHLYAVRYCLAVAQLLPTSAAAQHAWQVAHASMRLIRQLSCFCKGRHKHRSMCRFHGFGVHRLGCAVLGESTSSALA
jgi:hypothetical protein